VHQVGKKKDYPYIRMHGQQNKNKLFCIQKVLLQYKLQTATFNWFSPAPARLLSWTATKD